MKFIVRQYRVITIWLSIMIIGLAFTVGADRPGRPACVALAFLAGTLPYAAGSLREWSRNRMTACTIEMLLAVCMLVCTILSFLRLGGLL